MSLLSAWPVVAAMVPALATAVLLLRRRRDSTGDHVRCVSIDGLRGYLALGVFLHHGAVWYFYLHTGQWAPPPSRLYVHLGQSSVAMFFMITGFLFWSKLLDARVRPIDWSRLYLSRVLRLVPLYAFATLCLVICSFHASGFHRRESTASLVAHVSQWLAFTLLGTPPINGFTETAQILGVGWSLRYEWLFYAFLPVGALAIGMLRASDSRPLSLRPLRDGRPDSRSVPPLSWLLFGIAATASLACLIPGLDPIMFMAFGGGIFAAVLVRIEPLWRRFTTRFWSLVVAAALAAVVSLCSTAYGLPALALLTLAFTIIACGNSLFGVLRWPASRLLGEMSYSIYLLHNFVLFVAFRVVLGHSAASLTPASHWLVVSALAPVLVVLCHLTFHVIEAPAMAAVPRFHAWLAARFTRRAHARTRAPEPTWKRDAA